MEVAIAGFQQVEQPTLAPFLATLEQIQGEPRLTRQGSLLTGFLNELIRSLPVSSLPAVPVRRWTDLWTRGVVGSLSVPAPVGGTKVSGKLFPLGADLRHHGFFASVDVYGVLESDSPRVVRTTLSSYKVDVLAGGEVWRCFADAEELIQGLSDSKALDVKDATLLSSGDLVWDGKAKVGKVFSRAEIAAKYLAPGATCEFPGVAPADRHPVQIAELAYLTDVAALPVAAERLSPVSEVKPEHVEGATAVLGLLRFDGGDWAVQPLAVTRGGKGAEVFTGESAFRTLETKPKKGDTLTILKERASRLLRAKK